MGKVILWELCKRLEFDHADTYYLYKPESVPENETQNILENFEIQTSSKSRLQDQTSC